MADTHDTTVEPCRIAVEPGDLLDLAYRMPPDQRPEAIRLAMLHAYLHGAKVEDPEE